jgi:hypothetical protein
MAGTSPAMTRMKEPGIHALMGVGTDGSEPALQPSPMPSAGFVPLPSRTLRSMRAPTSASMRFQ